MSRREEVEATIRTIGQFDVSHERCFGHMLTLADEVDTLRAENAELKARYLHVAELNHNQVSMVRAYDAKADSAIRWERCFRIAFGLKNKYRADLAATNATLDALRETVQSDEWIYAKHTDIDGQMERIEDILYPQPKETTDDDE